MWPDEATAEDSGGDLPSGPGRQQGRQVTTRGRKEARTKSSEEAYSYEEPVHDLDYYNEYDEAPELDREEDEEEEEEEDEEPRLEGQPRRASKYAVVWVRPFSLHPGPLVGASTAKLCASEGDGCWENVSRGSFCCHVVASAMIVEPGPLKGCFR